MYAGKYSDVPLIVSIAARTDMSILPSFLNPVIEKVEEQGSAVIELAGKSFFIDKEGIYERKQINMKNIAERIRSWVFVVHGSEDQITHVRDSEELERILDTNCFERSVIPQAGHNFYEYESQLVQGINNFFIKAVPLLELRGKI